MTLELIKSGMFQIWANIISMDKKERKKLIKYVISIDNNSQMKDYRSKEYLIQIIKDSECYFNESGQTTPVKEFQELGL